MARAVLDTHFNGYDSHFQRAKTRVIAGGKKMGAVMEREFDRMRASAKRAASVIKKVGKAGAAAAGAIAAGAAAASNSVVGMFNEAQRTGADFESFQKFTGVLRQFRLDVDLGSDALVELGLSINEAIAEGGEKRAAFEKLGLDVGRMGKLAPVDRFLALAEAYKRAGGEAAALVATSKILGEETAPRLREVLGLGARGIEQRSRGVLTVDEGAARTARKRAAVLLEQGFNAKLNTVGAITPGDNIKSEDSLALDGALRAFDKESKGIVNLMAERFRSKGKAIGESFQRVFGRDEEGGDKFVERFGGGEAEHTSIRFRKGTRLSQAARRAEAEREAFFSGGQAPGRDRSGIPMSGAARSSASETERFFREARRDMQENRRDIEAIAEAVVRTLSRN